MHQRSRRNRVLCKDLQSENSNNKWKEYNLQTELPRGTKTTKNSRVAHLMNIIIEENNKSTTENGSSDLHSSRPAKNKSIMSPLQDSTNEVVNLKCCDSLGRTPLRERELLESPLPKGAAEVQEEMAAIEDIFNDSSSAQHVPQSELTISPEFPESPLPEGAAEVQEEMAAIQDIFNDAQPVPQSESTLTSEFPESFLLEGAAEVQEEMAAIGDIFNGSCCAEPVPQCESTISSEFRESSLPKGAAEVQEEMALIEDLLNDSSAAQPDPNSESAISPGISLPTSTEMNVHSHESFECYNITPIPSPVNRHKTCDDVFCAMHHEDDLQIPTLSPACSINTTASSQDSPNSARSSRSRQRDGGKKRRRNQSEWADVKRKCLKNLGKKYYTKRGKCSDEKVLGPPCSCKLNCNEKFTIADREEIFSNFWKLGDRQQQWNYVVKYTSKDKKRRALTTDVKHNRQYTYKYFLPQRSDEAEFKKVNVCKIFFLNTLSVGERIISTAWKKYDGSATIEKDMRGHHKNHKKVMTEAVVKSVCDHVESFAPVESHYTRKDSKKLYLDGSLSVALMYKLYNEWYNPEKYTEKATSERQYRDIVNEKFNLGFHIPKKDQCDECHTYKNISNPSEEQKVALMQHRQKKEVARNQKNKEKAEAISSNGSIICATFDFQKVLTCPHGKASIFYYKRKLSNFNFTVYDMAKKHGVCYMWHEGIAKRGANEVSSCLLDFIKRGVSQGAQEFKFWSDNCGGQNRNRIVFNLYLYAAKKFNLTITHSFLEKGHTQNEGDSVHAVIERASSPRTIYTPDEWQVLVRWAKADGNPYEVKSMTQDAFFDWKNNLKNKNWNKNTLNKKVEWSKIKQVLVTGEHSNQIQYKYNLTDEFETIIVHNTTRRYRSVDVELHKAYEAALPIKKLKYKDLVGLCESGIIPEKYHVFFKALAHED